ncbi:MAG: amidohydrolase family protein [Gammaproteobacteria bacterium]|nr:amidohydrolase family protein [Gammaproteobacteria bacterium]MBT8093567.1 amidohydrolase family protein [Gammaproteobacteria bacterium]NNF49360.1 amidohydrolase family protein [Woeseiaceae bacterium]
MRRFWPLVALLAGAPAVAADTTAFINVNVVPMDTERVIAQQTLIVRDGLIDAIGSVDDVPIPEGATVVDGTDRYLMPGLAEMHAHVAAADSPLLARYFDLYVANGVTTIRGMLGRESHLGLRDDLETGSRFGPRLVTSGPSLNGRTVSGVQQARDMVAAQHAAGYDFIKIHPGLTADEFDAAANTANALGMPFAGHVPVAAGVSRALELDMASIDHLDGYFAALLPPDSHGRGGFGGFFDVFLADEIDADRIADIAAATAEAGTWNVPTEVLIEQLVDATPVNELRNRPEMHYMPAATVADWVRAKESQLADRDYDAEVAALAVELRRKLILELQRAGAGLLLGSDSPQIFNVPGFSLHRELDTLVAAGLTPWEALYSGTVAVAAYLGSNTGIVAVGRAADLVLLDANPLDDIRNSRRIHGVVLRGAWLPAATLENRMERWRDDR